MSYHRRPPYLIIFVCAILLLCIGFMPSSIVCAAQVMKKNTSQVKQNALVHHSGRKQTDEGFELALPGYVYHFPEDHASHPSFKTEWWYYTGHLHTVDDDSLDVRHHFGYELTFFRIGQSPLKKPEADIISNDFWKSDTYYMAHFALTDETGQRFFHTQRFNRNTPFRAGADASSYHVWNEDWKARAQSNNVHEIQASHQKGLKQGFSLNLSLNEGKGPVIHGEKGVSQKADCHGCASHYYSLTRMPSKGVITLGDKTYAVEGSSWMDHEFGSNQLQKNQVGWDWFSLQLSDGYELMLYQMRLREGGNDPNSSGTWVDPSGQSTHISLSQMNIEPLNTWVSPHTKGQYPSGWRIYDTQKNIDVTVTPVLSDQELVPEFAAYGVAYWEGRCKVSGFHNGTKVSGEAYVELTGYDKPFTQKL